MIKRIIPKGFDHDFETGVIKEKYLIDFNKKKITHFEKLYSTFFF